MAKNQKSSPPLQSDKVEIDKDTFYRMAYAYITGRNPAESPMGKMMRFMGLLGATTFDEQKAKWEEVKAYMQDNPR